MVTKEDMEKEELWLSSARLVVTRPKQAEITPKRYSHESRPY